MMKPYNNWTIAHSQTVTITLDWSFHYQWKDQSTHCDTDAVILSLVQHCHVVTLPSETGPDSKSAVSTWLFSKKRATLKTPNKAKYFP